MNGESAPDGCADARRGLRSALPGQEKGEKRAPSRSRRAGRHCSGRGMSAAASLIIRLRPGGYNHARCLTRDVISVMARPVGGEEDPLPAPPPAQRR